MHTTWEAVKKGRLEYEMEPEKKSGLSDVDRVRLMAECIKGMVEIETRKANAGNDNFWRRMKKGGFRILEVMVAMALYSFLSGGFQEIFKEF